MVQYGFPAPITAPIARPLMDAHPVQGRVNLGGEDAARTAAIENSEKGRKEQQRRELMDELFARCQPRFVRESGGDNAAFETKVNYIPFGYARVKQPYMHLEHLPEPVYPGIKPFSFLVPFGRSIVGGCGVP